MQAKTAAETDGYTARLNSYIWNMGMTCEFRFHVQIF